MKELYPSYEKELAFIREMAMEFASQYPEAAGHLNVARFGQADPHVERLIEAFALLAARVHFRLDADYPEFTQSLLEILHPQLLRPMPSSGIVQFSAKEKERQDISIIRRGFGLIAEAVRSASSSPDAVEMKADCHFRTCFDVNLLPIRVRDAGYGFLESVASRTNGPGVFLRLECEPSFSVFGTESAPGSLRIHLRGSGHVPYTLYELLLSECVRVVIRDPQDVMAPLVLDSECLRPVGFAASDSLLPVEKQMFDGLRLLQEYFVLPEKYLFVDFCALRHIADRGFGSAVDVFFELGEDAAVLERRRPLRGAIGADNFALHCTPVVNLFERLAHVNVDQRRTEYPVTPDPRRKWHDEVYPVDSVSGRNPITGERFVYPHFQATLVGGKAVSGGVYWRAARRPSQRDEDSGTDVYLSLAYLGAGSDMLREDSLRVEVTCTNRDLPLHLAATPFKGFDGAPGADVEVVRLPTPPLRPDLSDGLEWSLISHLALDYLSLGGGELADKSGQAGAEALRSILGLYNFGNDPVLARQLKGVAEVVCSPAGVRIVRRAGQSGPPVVVAGYAVLVRFVEDAFRTSGHFLLASVLERFLGMTASVNSFTQMVAETDKGRRFEWAPRAGHQILR